MMKTLYPDKDASALLQLPTDHHNKAAKDIMDNLNSIFPGIRFGFNPR
ncbi:MAG: hypothetical protein ACHQNE_02560 [Candidatus Kapaibacterium sp.]